MRATLESDFNEFLADLDKVSVKLRDKFSGDVDRASGRLQRLTDSLDGNRTLQQAGLMVSALSRVGGAATLTDREIARLGPTVDEAVQKFQRLGRDVPASLARLKTELDQLRQPLAAVKADASGLGGLLSGVGSAVTQGLGIGAGLSIAGAVEGLVSSLGAVVSEGNRLAALSVPFERMSGGALAAQRKLDDLREATRGLVGDVQLLTASNQATVLGLDKMGLRFADVAKVGRILAQSMGQDVGQGVSDLVNGLAKGSAEVLNNLGVILRAEDAYKTYARSLGTTADELTDVQRQTAVAVVGFEQATRKAQELGDVPLTTAQQWERLVNAITSIGTKAVGLVDTFGPFRDLLAEMAGFAEAIRRALPGGTVKPPPGFGPGATAGAASYAAPGAPAQGGATTPPMQFVSTGVGGVSIVDGSLLQRRAQDAQREAKGVSEAAAALARAGAEYEAAEQRIAAIQRREGFGTESESARKRREQAEERDRKRQERQRAEREQRIDKLVGRSVITEALTSFDDLSSTNFTAAKGSVLKVFDDLVQAREVAKRIEPNAVAGLTGVLETLATKPEVAESVRKAGAAILKPLTDPAQLNTLLTQGTGFKNLGVLSGRELAEGIEGGLSRLRRGRFMEQLALDTLPRMAVAHSSGEYAAIADNAERTTLIFQEMKKSLEGIGIPLDDITKRTQKAIAQGRDWRGAVSGVAQAFSQLAQIAGGAFDRISQTIGTVFGGANAAMETVEALGKQFKSLLGKDGEGLSTGGKALAGGLAGLGVGSQLGGLFTNRGAGFGAGAAGGAVAGGLAGGLVGAGVGALVGGFAGLFAAAANASAQRAAKDISAAQLTSQFGGLDALLDVVGRLGLNQQTFLERFYGEPKEFGKAVTELNTALEKERLEADKLVKSLQAVARAQGVLSIGQINTIAATRPGSPAEGPLAEFFASQRQQTSEGLARAVDALTRNASLSQAETEALTKGVRDQEERDRILEDALGKKAKQTLTDFGAGAKAAAAGLFVAFDEAVRRGDSAVTALSNLDGPISQLRDLYANAGITPGAGFQQLTGLFDIATGDQTGPAVQLASGLGQALSGFQNQGLLSQDLFTDLTQGISESYFTLEALGKGGLDAARLMQPGLQSIWQLQKDFGFEVDANTQKLLDFAESSGLIGDQFRPAAELMVDGINQAIDRLDVLIQTLGGDLPEAQRRASRDVNPAGPKTPSYPGVPDPGNNDGVPDPTTFRVEIGDTTVFLNLDGDQVAEAVVRRIPGIVERVR